MSNIKLYHSCYLELFIEIVYRTRVFKNLLNDIYIYINDAIVLNFIILKIKKMNLRYPKAYKLCIIFMQLYYSIAIIETKVKRWYIGRTPPSSFEYSTINGFYTPKKAQVLCEKDPQCGGFTFKGSKRMLYMIPEVYFFHFINESSKYLTTKIKHPHWTTYIVGSRDHILISGSYTASNCASWRRLNRYNSITFKVSYAFK